MKRLLSLLRTWLLAVPVFLFLGYTPTSAQYYMNVLKKNGETVRFEVAELDNVFFTSTEVPSYEYVDLGLSVNWATFNVGATKPEEYGDYFAWGETEPKYDYSWSNYKFRTSGDSYDNVKFSKYNTKSDYGTVDNKTVLDPEDDVAHVKWGGSWRMPTAEEQEELHNNCTWTWYDSDNTEFNGVAGYKVTSNKDGYTDRFIFLPAAGSRYDIGLHNVGYYGMYWSSSLCTSYPSTAWRVVSYSSSVYAYYNTDRRSGFSVRPVCPSETWLDNISVTINQESAILHVGETVSLAATVSKGNDVVSYPVTWTSDKPEIASVDAEGVVTAKAVGKAKITATVQGKSASCVIEVTESSSSEYEYVDLGLSVNWATFNVGATKPEEYGDYFAWGETEPYYEAGYAQENPQAHWKDGKSDGYNWFNYKWCNGTYDSLTKYNTRSDYGTVDNKTVLDPKDDVAHVKWGGDWRMPAKAEQDELLNNCTWTWYASGNTEFNGVAGYKVTSNLSGYTDRYIFLPAAGYRFGPGLHLVGSYGNYWSSSLRTNDTNYSYYLYFNSGSHSTNYYSRCDGFSVRPVCLSETWANTISVTIDQEPATLLIGKTLSLTATVRKGDDVISYPVTWTSDKPEIASVSSDGVVTAISVGNAKITASVQGKSATFSVEVESVTYEYVDLGLSVNWATFNVGATVPEGRGDCFAWGETESKSSYKWCNGTLYSLTKYNTSSDYGTVDNKTVLDLEDDVAHVKWGGSWRMPTKEELEELRNNCTWTWYDSGNTEFGGVAGNKVTSNISGYADRYIFLPAHLFSIWSSSLNTYIPKYAYCIGFDPYGMDTIGNQFRDTALPVRPVCPSETWLDNVSVTIDQESASLHIGETVSLTATVRKGNDAVIYPVTWTSDKPEIASASSDGVVTAKAVGKAKITATVQGKSASCIIEVTSASSGEYVYVDLGLSVNWATFNVGATKPEEYGDYFAWGETEPKDDYDWSTYKFCTSGDSYDNVKFSKYNTKSNFGQVDNKTVLDSEDDVAHVKWGGSWRMPTAEEQEELHNNCTWTWYDSGNTEFNGVAGYKVTSNKDGYTDRFIFLPAAGSRYDTGLHHVGYYGEYWSCSLCTGYPSTAWRVFSYSSSVYAYYNTDRRSGCSVRPVCP